MSESKLFSFFEAIVYCSIGWLAGVAQTESSGAVVSMSIGLLLLVMSLSAGIMMVMIDKWKGDEKK